MSVSLRERTLDLLKDRSESIKIISENTGLSEPWIEAFLYQKPKNPSVTSVQKLYEYLTGKALLDE